jgi:hypothetical protein
VDLKQNELTNKISKFTILLTIFVHINATWRMKMLAQIWLYRITHIANLEHDLQHGLHIANSPKANPNYFQIGDSTLITYRKEIAAPNPPGGTLADYIPFYFEPRSPMLYQIASGWEDIEKHPQDDIVCYISSIDQIRSAGLKYFLPMVMGVAERAQPTRTIRTSKNWIGTPSMQPIGKATKRTLGEKKRSRLSFL